MCIVASARNPLKGIQNAVISAMFIVRCTLIPASEDPKNPCIGSTSPMVIQLHNRPLTSSVLAKNACSKAIDPKVISETFRWETQIFEFLGFSLSCRQTASFPSSLLESVRHQSFLPVPLHVCFFYHFLSSSGISFLTSLREWQRKTPCVSLCRTLLRLLSFAQPMSHNLFCVRPPSLRSFPATSTCFVIRPWVVFLFSSALSGSTQTPSFSSSHTSGWSPTSFQQLLLPGFLTFVFSHLVDTLPSYPRSHLLQREERANLSSQLRDLLFRGPPAPAGPRTSFQLVVSHYLPSATLLEVFIPSSHPYSFCPEERCHASQICFNIQIGHL